MPGFGTAHQTVTTGANFIPEIWSKDVQRATESNLVAGKLVKRFDAEVAAKGDILHIPLISNLVATAKSASTAVTFQSPTENKVDLTVNAHYESSILIEDILDNQSAYNLAQEYKEKMSYALSKKVDTDVLALYTNLSQSSGTSGVQPSDDDVLRGIQFLDAADAPNKDRAFIMGPSCKAALLGIDRYVSTDFTGAGDIPVKTGLFGQRYGLLFYVSTNLPTDSNGYMVNQMIHKEAYACAIQKNITMKSDYVIEHLATAYVAQVLYGVITYRAAFGVTILGK